LKPRAAAQLLSFGLALAGCDGIVTSDGADASVAGRTLSRCPGIEHVDGGCDALSFFSLCSTADLVVLRSDVADDQPSLELARGTSLACGGALAQRVASSHDGGVLDATGAPIGPRSQALVVAGGSFLQPLVRWLERSASPPIFDSSASGRLSLSSPTLGPLLSVPASEVSSSRDYFVIEVMRPELDGPLVLVAYGFYEPGTRAAAWFFSNRLMPSPAAHGSSWSVQRWTDLDGDGAPGAGDEFTLVGSGT
jgi:hypothetical protein